MTESESVEQVVTYVLYTPAYAGRNSSGESRSRLVTQKEWEKSWLDWWLKINRVQELD